MSRKVLHDTSYAKPATTRRRFRKRTYVVAGLGIAMLLTLIGIPLALQNRDLVVSVINRNAGIAPMRIDLASINGGWLRAFRVQGLRLIDDKGADLVKVAEIQTEMNLISLITNYRNLGTITIRGAEVALDVQPGTTNIEEAIKPLLGGAANTPPPAASTATAAYPTGRIRIAEAIVHARDSVDLTAWDIKITEADIPLPSAEQTIPPMTMIGLIQQTASLPGEALEGGQFTIKTQPIEGSPAGADGIVPMRMNVSTNGMPLQWFSLIKRRMPDIPIERIRGIATVQADVELKDKNTVNANLQTAQIDALRIVAPMLIGKSGAGMQQIKLSGNVQLNQNRLSAQNAILQCDVGSLMATAEMPWPIVAPTVVRPWLDDSDFDVQGSVDLARLIQSAPDLIQMQDQVKLVAGNATLTATQRKAPRQVGVTSTAPPDGTYRLQLGKLQANVNGKSMQWDQALEAKVAVSSNNAGQPSFQVDCTSEFCKIDGSGDLVDGHINSEFDLAKMQQRLSQWFALPVQSLSGSAQCAINWKQDSGNRLTASGRLKTTPVRIVNQYGKLDEPAWDGEFSVIARVEQNQIHQIDRAQVTLKAERELLAAQILDPISLVATPGIALPPAGMQLKLVGDLSGWQRRGQLFAGVDPGVQLGGHCELEARGAVDMVHLEVTQANWTTEPFVVNASGTNIREAQLVGNFTGRVDTQNITRLQVDNLLIQSPSFALQAKDAAVPNKDLARSGQAAFRIDPSRLMNAIQFESNGTTAPSDMRVEGEVTGQLQWNVDPTQLAWQIVSEAKNIRAIQGTSASNPNQLVSTAAANRPQATTIWEEPQANFAATGRYDIQSGKLEVSQSQVQTEWLAYAGQAVMQSDKAKTQVISQGNVTYDAARVAQRLRPWTGDYLAISGVRTQPVDVTWTSSNSGNWADALQAKTQVGWDSANLVGIEIGKGDVPLTIENGRFQSKAEIPVSQGVLRWNLDGNVAGNPMIIAQAPDKVIDNVAITQKMCSGWLKYVAPLLADVTSVSGNLSLQIDKAEIVPTDWKRQTVVGQLQVHGANVGPGPLADQLLMLVQQVRNLRKGAGATDGGGAQTTFLQLPAQQIGFAVEQGRVAHKNMQIQAGDVVIVTSGAVGIDGQLELIAAVPIQKDWLDKAPALQSLAGQQIQIPVRGTIQRPQLDMNSFASIGQQLATAAVQNVAQKQIDKGINKLLGPLSNQLGPFQQGMQQMQQGVQQNLPQLPLPNLQNLPIPGFGNGGPFGGGQQPQPPTIPPGQ